MNPIHFISFTKKARGSYNTHVHHVMCNIQLTISHDDRKRHDLSSHCTTPTPLVFLRHSVDRDASHPPHCPIVTRTHSDL